MEIQSLHLGERPYGKWNYCIMNVVCHHTWVYFGTHYGRIDYGGPVVSGYHIEEHCEKCGKIRIKLQRLSKWKIVKSRKENIKPRQLQLL